MNLLRLPLLAGIRLYQWLVSPVIVALAGPYARCRFTPTCSAYAYEAIARLGPWRGSWLALRRLGRCHPWGGCGHDPVPPGRPTSDSSTLAAPAMAAVRH